MEIIIKQEELQRRIKELALEITEDYKASGNSLPPVLICVLNGAYMFFTDLVRNMPIDCEIDFIRLKSYNGQDNSGGVMILKEPEVDLLGKKVYVVDDMCDTGATMFEAICLIESRQPVDLSVVTLLKRKNGCDIADFNGFEIGEDWVVGYGFDDTGLKRNLEDIYKIK
jgi:hypoxanthine phosphoribosyltransferase